MDKVAEGNHKHKAKDERSEDQNKVRGRDIKNGHGEQRDDE